VLAAGPDGTDVAVAERLIQRGRQTPDLTRAAEQFRAALALWRGRPLTDVSTVPWLAEQAERLAALELSATRALTDLRLARGEHASLVPELEQLAAQHPYDEELHRQLVLVSIARYEAERGSYADALQLGTEALTLAEKVGARLIRAGSLATIGQVRHQLGQLPDAVAAYEQAVELVRAAGGGSEEADLLLRLGDVHAEAGATDAARVAWQQSLRIFERTGRPGADPIRARLAGLPTRTSGGTGQPSPNRAGTFPT
jgi:tetratricopeptide (TPR) repeat protein